MSEKNENVNTGYSYQDDEPQDGLFFQFGLTAGSTYLKKFKWITDGGKGGSPQDALDIIFEVEGKEKGYRQFPVVQAFHNNETVTDPKHQAMINKKQEISSVLTHIISCFVPKEDIQLAIARPMDSFEEYCKILKKLLPKGYSEIALDSFMVYQWQISGENTQTFLEFPKKTNYGRWLCREQTVKGEWVKTLIENPVNKEQKRNTLTYVDSEDPENIHPFIRNSWFMEQPFAKQIKEKGTTDHDTLKNAAEKADNDDLPWED